MSGHTFQIVQDVQRKRGWYLSYRCARRGCDAKGNMTVPTREKAVKLLTILDEGHKELTADE